MRIEEILMKINDLLKEAPSDWAQTVADEMGKSVDSVYLYAKCARGIRRGYPAKVLEILSRIISEQNQKLEKLLN